MAVLHRLDQWIENALAAGGRFADQITRAIENLTDPKARRQAAFSVAMIALSAKMAKADGIVTLDEVNAFQALFEIPQDEQANVARMFNLAKQDTAGFEYYAQKIAKLYDVDDQDVLEDVLDGLFIIARADGVIHEAERAYLSRVAEIFSIDSAVFDMIEGRHIDRGPQDPFRVLGVEPTDSFETIRKAYRRQVNELHPDRMIAKGVPPEFLAIANDRMAAVNNAWSEIQRFHNRSSA